MANAFLNLEDIDSSIGFKINGVASFDTSGFSVSGAKDINGDGIEDAIIGAPGFNGSNPNATNTPGNVYVVFGNENGFPDELELSQLNGTNGFAIAGIAAKDLTGISVSGKGDVNNDGFADVIIGAREADPNGLDKAGHLNGLAMRDGQPRYVTAVSQSDVADGWRDKRRDGGCVIDVSSNEVILTGLSMPHSPRWYSKQPSPLRTLVMNSL